MMSFSTKLISAVIHHEIKSLVWLPWRQQKNQNGLVDLIRSIRKYYTQSIRITSIHFIIQITKWICIRNHIFTLTAIFIFFFFSFKCLQTKIKKCIAYFFVEIARKFFQYYWYKKKKDNYECLYALAWQF